ncbi:MAG: hypothetical protein ACJA1A_001824 [Saprospiraceae bacterium]|jgi:hypothetical protein
MKNTIKHIIIFIFLFFINEANGQLDEINWDPELEGKGLVELIGEQGDYIYMLLKLLKQEETESLF